MISAGIEECLGYALGCVRLSYDDFCRCTPSEFNCICKAYNEQREADYKDGWERMRLLATIVIQPHLRKKVTANNLLKFPWDRERVSHVIESKPISAEESKRRFEELVKKQKSDYYND